MNNRPSKIFLQNISMVRPCLKYDVIHLNSGNTYFIDEDNQVIYKEHNNNLFQS